MANSGSSSNNLGDKDDTQIQGISGLPKVPVRKSTFSAGVKIVLLFSFYLKGLFADV
jgi:hypothetical protein